MKSPKLKRLEIQSFFRLFIQEAEVKRPKMAVVKQTASKIQKDHENLKKTLTSIEQPEIYRVKFRAPKAWFP